MLHSPDSASAVNQSTQTGPNRRPTTPVPFFWMKKRPIRIPVQIGTI